ncbi:unnamed protein product [Bursaphelenchus xylophilus]|uniref:(pine wood nematode) hypothetical protein n=1 Tax=Bursaphelenchus xylophilus TaxID=6326 RepID=A0A7I8X6X8_BURXY|nr:unnamed protein product [Bursaphelenchus xylophilus]CAG9123627.1 unnamed protein product [Bursaphelenchus xylophilus]
MSNNRTRSRSQRLKDDNAPKRPLNAYKIFYKHYYEQFNRKNPTTAIDAKTLISQIGRAWRGLSEEEKQPFQEKALKDKQRYEKEFEDYKKSADYKKFVKKQEAHLPDIPVFSKEFVKHNKGKEAELRQLRKEISSFEDKAAPIVDRINDIQEEIDALNKDPKYLEILEKEKLMGIWTRKLIPELERAGLLDELGISFETSPEELIDVMESVQHDGSTMNKLKSAFNKFYLPLSS